MTSNLDEINTYFRKNQRAADKSVVLQLVQKFVQANANARQSPNLQTKSMDDWSGWLCFVKLIIDLVALCISGEKGS